MDGSREQVIAYQYHMLQPEVKMIKYGSHVSILLLFIKVITKPSLENMIPSWLIPNLEVSRRYESKQGSVCC